MSPTVPRRAAPFLDSTIYAWGGGLNTSDDGVVCPPRDGGDESSGSSSIGVDEDHSSSSLSDSSSKTGEDEVRSRLRLSPLESLESAVDDALPIKRGLSDFFNGKSKSFQCLSQVLVAAPAATANGLAKKEHPFNKRKRILMASKSSWRRRASCTPIFDTRSLSGLHSLEENRREEEEEEVDETRMVRRNNNNKKEGTMQRK